MASIDQIKETMRGGANDGDGLIWPMEVQEALLEGIRTGQDIHFKYTKWGLSISGLFDFTWYTFYFGSHKYAVENVNGSMKENISALEAWHESEIKAGRWTDGRYPLPKD